ncbi:hypothetical protein [Roseomonas sp. BN140053]|uniref:hypothetical protein n=1 Tax=Roseomonas sp. BN140053 TaxID=3391898 RepID=UPI0039EA995A
MRGSEILGQEAIRDDRLLGRSAATLSRPMTAGAVRRHGTGAPRPDAEAALA